ncbi:unnamed protein product, partial [Iphiclides podalirius]
MQFSAIDGVIQEEVELFKYLRDLAKKHKGIYRFWCFPFGAVFIYNPEDIEKILSSTKYNQKSDIYTFLQPWLQDGLLLSYGAKWQSRRKILTPAFHFKILRKYFTSLEENSNRLVNIVNAVLDVNVDVVPIISEYTLNSICESAMGTKLTDECRKVINERRKNFVCNEIDLCENTNDKDDDDDDNVYNEKKKAAMLNLLLLAEKDGLIDTAGVEEEVDTFIFEGHDTTASGLTFLLMLIANHPYIQDRIVEELKEIFRDTKRAAAMEDFAAMSYLDRCIKESLRLYPPVPMISRKLDEDVQLSKYTVPAGTLCHIQIYDLHHNERLYPNPLKFDPDRFLPENVAGRHNYAYVPFSAGPRNCIGQKFAMMQMKSAVSAILRNYVLLPVTSCSDLCFQSDLVLRNSKPVFVRFVKRENSI